MIRCPFSGIKLSNGIKTIDIVKHVKIEESKVNKILNI